MKLSMPLTRMTAVELVAFVRAGNASAAEVAEAVIVRHHNRQEQVRAYAFFDPEQVRAAARELDERPRKGPLHGVPIAVKDVIQTVDMPTEYGNGRYAGHRGRLDAACIDTLRAAGSLIVGKTVTTEFAASRVGGPTRNPVDLTRTPGGSSSGSAAAVADFQATVAIGTQTGGSTIRPASYCGIYGWKPTWNSISREGLKMFSATCDTVGFFSRSAADLDLLAQVFDLEVPEPGVPETFDQMRVAVCRTPMWEKALPATRRALERGAEQLREAGARVIDLDLPVVFRDLVDATSTVIAREARSAFLNEYRNVPDLGDSFRAIVENHRGITAGSARSAYQLLDRCRLIFDSIAADYDVVLTPSATGEAPSGLASTGDASFNSMWTGLQVPVVNVPGCVGPGGLPVGLSLIGRRYDDRRLLGWAEKMRDVLA